MLNNRSSFFTEFFFIVILVAVIFLGEWLGLVRPLTSALERFSQPVLIRMSHLAMVINQPVAYVQKSFHAARRVQDLEKEYSYALATISRLEYVEQENQELRHLLETQERHKSAIVVSRVISYGLPSVSVGQAEGISPGQSVLASQTLIGLTKIISTHQSQVNLLAQNVTNPILAKTESGVEGIVIGDGKRILLTEVPKDAELTVGERVVTIGQELIQPRLLIGQVKEVIDRPSAPIKQAIIEQLVSFYEVPILEVL
ncbi:MAG: rod shape-determining protein MreC [Patescibacteria group bacterium]